MKVSEIDLTAIDFAKRRRLASQIGHTWIEALEYPGLILFLRLGGTISGGYGSQMIARQRAREAGQFRLDKTVHEEKADILFENLRARLLAFDLAKGQRPC